MVASQDAEGDRSHWVEGSLDWEDAILEWEETDRVGAEVQWRRGNIALALNPIYGDKTLEKFAERMQVELRRVEEYRQVSKAYEIRVRTRNLSWTHHARIVARPDRLKWLKDADAGEWSVARMLQQIEASDAKLHQEEIDRQNAEYVRRMALDLAALIDQRK